MVNYTSQNQLKLELFKHPFEAQLDKNNRWVKLAEIIPWDALAAIYSRKLQSNKGRLSVNIRTVIAALIVKHKLRLDDRGTIEMIKENIYLQYFCGLESFTTKAVFDPSLFVDIRKRLGSEEFDKFNQKIIEQSEQIKPHQARIKQKIKNHNDGNNTKGNKPESHNLQKESNAITNKGTLKVDATVADQEIRFPNDAGLLNESRRQLERMIGKLYKESIDGDRPRIYPRKARKEYLNFSKKKRKSKKEIRRAIKSQLQYVRRDIKVLEQMLNRREKHQSLKERDIKMFEVIRQIYRQQKWMYDHKTHTVKDRIVSLYQWWVRPIVRGKDRHKVEFGSKINVSEVDGFCRIDQFSWDAYNEGGFLQAQVEKFKELYGRYPKYLLGDKLYLTRENRKYLNDKGIEIVGSPLGRPKKKDKENYAQQYRKKKKSAQRNHVEGKFGQAKRGYGLNNIKARLPETSESWVNSIFFVMNLMNLLVIADKYGKFFMSFLNRVLIWVLKIDIFVQNCRNSKSITSNMVCVS